MADDPEDQPKETPASTGGILDSWWNAVKSSATLENAQLALQEAQKQVQNAQHQAQQQWENYDMETFSGHLRSLGKSATDYIDSADRRLEELETTAVHFLQERGTEFVDIVKESTNVSHPGINESESEVIFTGPESIVTASRLDAELLSLYASPTRFTSAEFDGTTPNDVQELTSAEQDTLLKSSSELSETYKSLVPSALSSAQFWHRYVILKAQLVDDDKKRKRLIERQGQAVVEQSMLDDWGSSDEEDKPRETKLSEEDKSKEPKLSAPVKSTRNIEDEGSDDDWE